MTFRNRVLFLVAAMALAITNAEATPVREITNLSSITFWETTGIPRDFTFGVTSSQLTTRLSDPLSSSNNDISGASTEYYDVYYSDGDGSFNLDGEYLTISGSFGQSLPAGGGLNLAEIGLNFTGLPTEYGNWVASFVALGDNALQTPVSNAIDGDLNTYTVMGNNAGQSERLRVTLGFESSSGPPPSVPLPATISLLLPALASTLLFRRRRRAQQEARPERMLPSRR